MKDLQKHNKITKLLDHPQDPIRSGAAAPRYNQLMDLVTSSTATLVMWQRRARMISSLTLTITREKKMSRSIRQNLPSYRSRTYLSLEGGSQPVELLLRIKSLKHLSTTVISKTLLRMIRVFYHPLVPIMEEVTPVSHIVLTLIIYSNSIVAHLPTQITHSYFPTNRRVITVKFQRIVAQIELVQEEQPTPTRLPLEGLDPSRVLWEATNKSIPAKNNS